MNPSAGPVLTRGSTAEELAGVLREMIFRGELGADEPMREATLSERYEVSRRTVREALNLLEHDGLVRHHRHKGSRVTRLQAGDIRDLYRVRRTLELSAAAHAAHARPDRLEALANAFQALSEATTVGRAEEIVVRDLEFHRAVVGLLVSPRIDAFYAAIGQEMRYALTVLESSYQESRNRPAAALDEHRQIYEALRRGDADTATALITEHIEVNEALLVDAVTAAAKD